MKQLLIGTVATVLAFGPVLPAAAQDGEWGAANSAVEDTGEWAEEAVPADDLDFMGALMGGLAGMFPVEPLTAEQEARLPLAGAIIGKMMPDGAMAEMMGSMFDGMLGPLMQMDSAASASDVAPQLGFESYELYLEEEQAREAIDILDPSWKARKDAEAAIFPQIMQDMMTAMEPAVRKAMTELYAINFTDSELAGIDAFFSTETGASFARKSFTMASDPRVMSASMEAMPAIMGSVLSMEQKIADATADLPPKRSFAELSARERSRLAELTGYSVEEIEQAIIAREEAAMAPAIDAAEWAEEAAEDAEAY